MGRESLSTQGEFDLDGTKANHDGHLDASIIDRTGATEMLTNQTRATAILWHLGRS